MTIFAGIFARRSDVLIPQGHIEGIRRTICRTDGHARHEFLSTRCFISAVDMGAFARPGVVEVPGKHMTAVVGDPVLLRDHERRFEDRFEDCGYLGRALASGTCAALNDASGTFAGVHFDSASNRLFVFTDKLAVRPVYVATSDEFFAFSTALRVLEELAIVPLRLDLRGLIEQVALHWPLGHRTSYLDVSVLRPSECWRVDDGGVSHERYWRWPVGASTQRSNAEHLAYCHERFLSAIRWRLGGANSGRFAFLSGGLDSRCIVAGLDQLDVQPATINFAPPNTQDQAFARTFANSLGTQHLEIPIEELARSDSRSIGVSRFLATAFPDNGHARGRLIWTGSGGSVGVGHVYMTQEIVDALRAGRTEAAVETYMRNNGQRVTPRPLARRVYETYRDLPRQSLIDEIREIESADPARRFYVLLMENDQRRSMYGTYEDIDLHGLDFLVPFFDASLLTAIYDVPVDFCLNHRFYNEWLRCFGDATWKTPWQVYPRHVPCPIPAPAHLGSQFEANFSRQYSVLQHRKGIRHGLTMLTARHFPATLLSRTDIGLATGLGLLGIPKFDYVLDKGYQYFKHAAKAARAARVNRKI